MLAGACGHQLEQCQLLLQLADGGLLVGGHTGHYGCSRNPRDVIAGWKVARESFEKVTLFFLCGRTLGVQVRFHCVLMSGMDC